MTLHKRKFAAQACCIVAVAAGDAASCLQTAKAAAAAGADILELRVDICLEHGQEPRDLIAAVRLATPLPILLTIRHADEGGYFKGSEAARLEQYLKLMPWADLVDVEIMVGDIAKPISIVAKRENIISLGSFHDFVATPASHRLTQLAAHSKALGFDICKLAVTAQQLADIEQLATWTAQTSPHQALATMAMGPFGAYSRLINPLLGSRLVYGFLLGSSAVVPGQVAVQELRRWLNTHPQGWTLAQAQQKLRGLPANAAELDSVAALSTKH